MIDPNERALAADPSEFRRVRSRRKVIVAGVLSAVFLVLFVVSVWQYDALVAISSTYEGRRDGLRDAVAPGAVLLTGLGMLGSLVTLVFWAFRWERVSTGTKLDLRATSCLAVAPHEAQAALDRFRSGDPHDYLPLPLTKHSGVVFAIWLAKADRVAYVTVAVQQGREWRPLPALALTGDAYPPLSELSIDNYGSRVDQTMLKGLLDPFLRN